MNLSRNIVWIVLLFALLGVGCASANRESSADEALAEAIPSEAELDGQLTSNRLSESQLRAFEIRAQQKLRDLIDYLNIVSNNSLDSTFRYEAARQAESLLISSSVNADADADADADAEQTNATAEELRVYRLLDALDHPSASRPLTIAAVTVRQPLAPDGPSQYWGTLSFKKSSAEENTEHEATIVVRKVEKTFGEEVDVVWEVLLGDIQ